jgi:hypothetical protein
MEAGSAVLAFNASSVATLTFPTAFPNGVMSTSFTAGDVGVAGLNFVVTQGSVSTSSCQLTGYSGATGIGAVSVRVNYIIIGF